MVRSGVVERVKSARPVLNVAHVPRASTGPCGADAARTVLEEAAQWH